MADTRVVFDEQALDELFESSDGPVARDLARRTIRVRTAAVRRCPVDTGRLRSSIAHELGRDARGFVGVVGTNVHYGKYVETGTGRMRAQPYLRPALDAAR